jgi:AcrR family transcriptional regulator
MARTAASSGEPLSHNLLGQRLGKKGRDTRERILAATEKLLAGPADAPITLSAVAREASLGMTSLYLYFTDLTELLLAILEPAIASAEDSYIGQLRHHWPDDALYEHCQKFVNSYYHFWVQHSRVLHLRNSFADSGDERMRQHRIDVSQPLIRLLVLQMNHDETAVGSRTFAMATVLMTGLERMITMATDAAVVRMRVDHPFSPPQYLLDAETTLLSLGIAECRARNPDASANKSN